MNLLCTGIANWCKKNGAVSEEDYPIILYGIQLCLSTSLKMLGILLIGALLHHFAAVFISMAVFCSMRYWTGGWHSKSHLGCFSAMPLPCVCPSLLLELDGNWMPWALGCMLIYSVYKVLRYAPCNSKINPIENPKILKRKRIGSIIETAGIVIGVLIYPDIEIQRLIIMPLLVCAAMINRKMEGYEESKNFLKMEERTEK